MSNYYDYREVGVMVAHRLMTMEGWEVYGYKADDSDSMTDYYSPAYWNGIATKNGYVLCINVSCAEERKEIKKYSKNALTIPAEAKAKIKKLEAVTVERGATIHEEKTAQEKIKVLQDKQEACENEYEVIGYTVAHQANPNRCNWHIEKDGVIIAKGNGLLKYSEAYNYFNYDHYKRDLDLFKKSPEQWLKDWIEEVTIKGYYTTEEAAEKAGQSHFEDMQKTWKIIEAFNKFITKIDTTCGGMIGEGEAVEYEKVIVTEYKKENKVVECNGSLKEGQCFILKTGFNYGGRKGLVYRIHEREYNGNKSYCAYKLNGKLAKECTGQADQSNRWSCFGEKFDKWIETGAIAFCRIEEVKTPYEVEKLVKKVIKADTEKQQQEQQKEVKTEQATTPAAETTTIKNNYTYIVSEDTDTRDDSLIYLVKVEEKLDREEYKELAKMIKSLGGYYSRFKHAFIFKEDPRAKLGLCENETPEEPQQAETLEEAPEQVTTGEADQQAEITQEQPTTGEPQNEPEEVATITFNKSMKTIEIRLEHAKEGTIKLLKDNNYTWLSFVSAYVKDDNYYNRQFIQDNFPQWVDSVA